MKLTYNVNDRPTFGKLITFAIQQMLAIMAATIAVPMIVGNGMSTAAAMFGAGVGTIIYLLFTKFKSPVFLGSSFAFIGSMSAAFAGGVSMALGYLGLIVGAVMAGFVYVIISIIIKLVGVNWINKLMPPVVIGPTVALIGLSLAGPAIKDVFSYGPQDTNGAFIMSPAIWASLICALVTLVVIILCSVYGKKMGRLIPFIIGILSGYAVASVFTVIGDLMGIAEIKLIDFSVFASYMMPDGGVSLETFLSVPDFTFLTAFDGVAEFNAQYLTTLFVAYVPVAFVVFAEHIADHKNLSSIIEHDLLEDPGLSRTLLGDGVGSMFGAFFGGCPNTTYGESVGCVAITKNASVITILFAAIGCILISFITPLVAFVNSIPGCVMGGVCITLYGFIAVSGLKMIQKVNLESNANLFTVASILIPGIGGMAMAIGKVTITAIASSLILGIIVNIIGSKASEQE